MNNFESEEHENIIFFGESRLLDEPVIGCLWKVHLLLSSDQMSAFSVLSALFGLCFLKT